MNPSNSGHFMAIVSNMSEVIGGSGGGAVVVSAVSVGAGTVTSVWVSAVTGVLR